MSSTAKCAMTLALLAATAGSVASNAVGGDDSVGGDDFFLKMEKLMDRTMERRLAEQERKFEAQRARDRAEYERALAIMEARHEDSKRTISALAAKVPGGEAALEEEASGSARRRRNLATGGTEFSGLWVKRDDAGIKLGTNGDVQIVRSGEDAATIHSSLTVNGTLMVGADGDVGIERTGVAEATMTGNLVVDGTLHGAARSSSDSALRICVGASPHEDWLQYSTGTDIYQDISIADCNFASTPEIFTSLSGRSSHWQVTGVTSIYSESKTGFRVYIHHDSADAGALADSKDWSINWAAFGV